ncbi:hypothetical protein ABIA33_004920 [Streptacidiphilus sp. MAP12-16]|uniref:hypothetical protein n=1 Tax=Streptacidiphilus sp. MAP12-16 TaxID=3156300 RepID=UPI0035164648
MLDPVGRGGRGRLAPAKRPAGGPAGGAAALRRHRRGPRRQRFCTLIETGSDSYRLQATEAEHQAEQDQR